MTPLLVDRLRDALLSKLEVVDRFDLRPLLSPQGLFALSLCEFTKIGATVSRPPSPVGVVRIIEAIHVKMHAIPPTSAAPEIARIVASAFVEAVEAEGLETSLAGEGEEVALVKVSIGPPTPKKEDLH